MKQLFRLLIFLIQPLHVSGDKFAHPQEDFLTVYTAFGTMKRNRCRPFGSSVGVLLPKAVYTVKR